MGGLASELGVFFWFYRYLSFLSLYFCFLYISSVFYISIIAVDRITMELDEHVENICGDEKLKCDLLWVETYT